MATIKAFIKKHTLLSYFALAFAISWGGILTLVGGPSGLPANKEQAETLFPFVMLAMLAGPSVAGILMTGLVHGRAGFRDLLARMTKWRIGARWYAVALLTAPLLTTAVLLALSLSSPEFLPRVFTSDERASLLLFGVTAGLIVGIFEELGWTGFAVPTLLRLRYGVLGTGLMVGFVWGVWHYLVNFWGSGTSSGALSLALFLPGVLDPVGVLLAFRVLMVWVYERTNGSLFVAMLMHASLTASITPFILRPALSGVPLLTYLLILTAAVWVFVAAVAVAQGGHLSRQPPLRRRVA